MKKNKINFLALIIISITLTFCSKGDSQSDSQISALPEIAKYSVSISASEGGVVDTQSGTFNAGTVITVTASPNEGYEFVGWTGSDETATQNTLTVNSNIVLVANFRLIPITEYTITVNAGVGGVVSSGGTFA